MDIEKRLELCQRHAANNQKYWLRAAREALAGDMRSLRLRVAMTDMPPVEVVLS